MQLSGRVTLVTGAAHRVGRAIAVALAARGARVAVHYHGAQEEADTTIQQLKSAGVEAQGFQTDLTDVGTLDPLIANVTRHFGALDLLVNSAAIMQRTPIGTVTVSQWDAMFALNVRAPFFLSQAARPHLASSHGAIVNIADLA